MIEDCRGTYLYAQLKATDTGLRRPTGVWGEWNLYAEPSPCRRRDPWGEAAVIVGLVRLNRAAAAATKAAARLRFLDCPVAGPAASKPG